jgi:hypothetical protein
MTSTKVVRRCTAACTAALIVVLPFSAIAGTCGHDVHGGTSNRRDKTRPQQLYQHIL